MKNHIDIPKELIRFQANNVIDNESSNYKVSSYQNKINPYPRNINLNNPTLMFKSVDNTNNQGFVRPFNLTLQKKEIKQNFQLQKQYLQQNGGNYSLQKKQFSQPLSFSNQRQSKQNQKIQRKMQKMKSQIEDFKNQVAIKDSIIARFQSQMQNYKLEYRRWIDKIWQEQKKPLLLKIQQLTKQIQIKDQVAKKQEESLFNLRKEKKQADLKIQNLIFELEIKNKSILQLKGKQSKELVQSTGIIKDKDYYFGKLTQCENVLRMRDMELNEKTAKQKLLYQQLKNVKSAMQNVKIQLSNSEKERINLSKMIKLKQLKNNFLEDRTKLINYPEQKQELNQQIIIKKKDQQIKILEANMNKLLIQKKYVENQLKKKIDQLTEELFKSKNRSNLIDQNLNESPDNIRILQFDKKTKKWEQQKKILQKKYTNLQHQFSENNQQYEKIKDALKKGEHKQTQLQNKIKQLKIINTKYQQHLYRLKRQHDIELNKLNNQIIKLKAQIQQLQEKNVKQIDEYRFQQKKISDQDSSIKKYMNINNLLQKDVQKLNQQIKVLIGKYNSQLETINKNTSLIELQKKQLEMQRKNIKLKESEVEFIKNNQNKLLIKNQTLQKNNKQLQKCKLNLERELSNQYRDKQLLIYTKQNEKANMIQTELVHVQKLNKQNLQQILFYTKQLEISNQKNLNQQGQIKQLEIKKKELIEIIKNNEIEINKYKLVEQQLNKNIKEIKNQYTESIKQIQVILQMQKKQKFAITYDLQTKYCQIVEQSSKIKLQKAQLQTQINRYRSSIQQKQSSINKLTDQIDLLKKNIKIKDSELIICKKNIKQSNILITNKIQDEFRQRLDEYQLIIDHKNKQMSSIQIQSQKSKRELIMKINEQMEQKNSQLLFYQQQIEKLDNIIQHLKSQIEQNQKMNRLVQDQTSKQLTEANMEIIKLKQQINVLQSKLLIQVNKQTISPKIKQKIQQLQSVCSKALMQNKQYKLKLDHNQVKYAKMQQQKNKKIIQLADSLKLISQMQLNHKIAIQQLQKSNLLIIQQKNQLQIQFNLLTINLELIQKQNHDNLQKCNNLQKTIHFMEQQKTINKIQQELKNQNKILGQKIVEDVRQIQLMKEQIIMKQNKIVELNEMVNIKQQEIRQLNEFKMKRTKQEKQIAKQEKLTISQKKKMNKQLQTYKLQLLQQKQKNCELIKQNLEYEKQITLQNKKLKDQQLLLQQCDIKIKVLKNQQTKLNKQIILNENYSLEAKKTIQKLESELKKVHLKSNNQQNINKQFEQIKVKYTKLQQINIDLQIKIREMQQKQQQDWKHIPAQLNDNKKIIMEKFGQYMSHHPQIQICKLLDQLFQLQSIVPKFNDYKQLIQKLLGLFQCKSDNLQQLTKSIYNMYDNHQHHKQNLNELKNKIEWFENSLNLISNQNIQQMDKKDKHIGQLNHIIQKKDHNINQMRSFIEEVQRKNQRTQHLLQIANKTIITNQMKFFNYKYQQIENKKYSDQLQIDKNYTRAQKNESVIQSKLIIQLKQFKQQNQKLKDQISVIYKKLSEFQEKLSDTNFQQSVIQDNKIKSNQYDIDLYREFLHNIYSKYETTMNQKVHITEDIQLSDKKKMILSTIKSYFEFIVMNEKRAKLSNHTLLFD